MILALDSSAERGSVALVKDGRVVRELSIATPRGRGGALFSALEEILDDEPEILRVVAGTGPGSYNGIRSALSVAWGIAKARGVPLIGVSSLLGLADGDFCAVGDARRGHYYFARVSRGSFVWEPVLLEKAGVMEELEKTAELPVWVPAAIDFLPRAVVGRPDAARLARIGAGLVPTGDVPEPLYLKPAYITGPVGLT